MLTNPEFGWVNVSIGDWSDRASYLTDVPLDILDAFIESYRSFQPATIMFDAEGWEYIIIADDIHTYVIDYLHPIDKYPFLKIFDIHKEDLMREFIDDIDRDYDAWVRWVFTDDENDILKRKEELDKKLKTLRELIS